MPFPGFDHYTAPNRGILELRNEVKTRANFALSLRNIAVTAPYMLRRPFVAENHRDVGDAQLAPVFQSELAV
jgi:hypothetical protein